MESKGGKGSNPITGCEVTSCGGGGEEERRGEGCITSSSKHRGREMVGPAGRPFVLGSAAELGTSCSLACPHMHPHVSPREAMHTERTL